MLRYHMTLDIKDRMSNVAGGSCDCVCISVDISILWLVIEQDHLYESPCSWVLCALWRHCCGYDVFTILSLRDTISLFV